MNQATSAGALREKRKNGVLYVSLAVLCAFNLAMIVLRMRHSGPWHPAPGIDLGIMGGLALKYAVDITDSAVTRERGILLTSGAAGAILPFAGFLVSDAVALALAVAAIGTLMIGLLAARHYARR